MNDVWVETTLGAVAEIVGGGTPSTSEPSYWGEDVVWLTPTEVVKADGTRIGSSGRMISASGLANSSAKMLPRNTVLLTTRASVGFVALADCALATNQGFQSLIPGPSVTPEFLMYWVQGNRTEFTSRAGGSTFPEIGKSKVQTIPISLPPLPVQRRIVDLMAHLDNQIANLRLERDSAGAVRVATLSTLLDATREVPADYDAAFDLAASAPQASPTSEQTINNGWPDLGVADVTVMVKRGRAPEYADHGALVVSQKCIQYGNEFATALARRTDALSKPVPEWAWLLETDTLVNSTGRGTLGRAAYVGRLDEPTTADSHVAIVRPDPRKVVPRFLGIVLSASFTKIESLQSGSTSQTELSPSSLLMMHIPVPPLPVQRRIVDLMAHLDNQIAGIDVEVSTLESLRRQLLASLLSQGVELPASYDLLLDGVA